MDAAGCICRTCRWWDQMDIIDHTGNRREIVAGKCRVNPPLPVWDDSRCLPCTRWPEVAAFEWCSRWQLNPGYEEDQP